MNILTILNGKKTYVLAGIGIIAAVAGHFWGPFQIGDETIPKLTTPETLHLIWHSAIVAALRSGIGSKI